MGCAGAGCVSASSTITSPELTNENPLCGRSMRPTWMRLPKPSVWLASEHSGVITVCASSTVCTCVLMGWQRSTKSWSVMGLLMLSFVSKL